MSIDESKSMFISTQPSEDQLSNSSTPVKVRSCSSMTRATFSSFSSASASGLGMPSQSWGVVQPSGTIWIGICR